MKMKFKLSKIAWLILGIGIFVIAIVGLYLVYNQQKNEQQEVSQNTTTAQNTLSETILIKENLSVRDTFPESVESIEYDEVLFNFASDHNLEIITVTVSEPYDITVEEMATEEEVTYAASTFIVSLEGDVANVLNFVNSIANGTDFNVATMEQVDIKTPVPLTEAEKEAITESYTLDILYQLADEELSEEERQFLLAQLDEAFTAADKEIEEAETHSAVIRFVVYSYKGE
jgi:hypothetical protein